MAKSWILDNNIIKLKTIIMSKGTNNFQIRIKRKKCQTSQQLNIVENLTKVY